MPLSMSSRTQPLDSGRRGVWRSQWRRGLFGALLSLALVSSLALWSAGLFISLVPARASTLLATTLGCGLALAGCAVFGRRRRLASLGSAIALAAGVGFLASLAAAPREALVIHVGSVGSLQPDQRFRFLQLNVRHGYPGFEHQSQRVAELARALESLDVDVVILQEAWRVRGHGALSDRLARELGFWSTYARANGSLRLLGFEEGSAVLSRFPIVAATRLHLSPRRHPFAHRIGLQVDLELRADEIYTFVGTHLASSAAEIAEAQAADLLAQLDEQDLLLVAGDFNQDRDSPTLRQFQEAGFEEVLSAGVDHVLLAPTVSQWTPLWSQVTPADLSDHPGLLVEMAPSGPAQRSRWRHSWRSGDPAVHGFDAEKLERTAAQIGELEGVTSLLVAHDGELLVERYFRGAGARRLQNLKSASKSVLSAVVGIAAAEGYFSLDTRIASILAGPWIDETGKSEITIRHLLTMTAGLESTSFDAYGSWVSSRDWVANALSRPLESPPGTRFRYSTGNTHILSALVAATTGRSTLDYAREKLFEPLGIRQVRWDRDPSGIHIGGNNLSLRPRDMARFGQLYLDRGRWGKEQVVPWQWVDESTSPVATTWRGGGYGYLWWIRSPEDYGAYSASGYGGQYIYVSRAHDMVIVVTSTEVPKGRPWRRDLFDLLREGILASSPAVPKGL